MALESNTYSGICKYKDIDFTFIFSGEELRLVPPADKREIIQTNWVLTPLAKGVYTRGNPLTMDEPYLTGKCNETGKQTAKRNGNPCKKLSARSHW